MLEKVLHPQFFQALFSAGGVQYLKKDAKKKTNHQRVTYFAPKYLKPPIKVVSLAVTSHSYV